MLDLIVDLNEKIIHQPKPKEINLVDEFPLSNGEYPATLPKGSKWTLVYHNGYHDFYYHDRESSRWLSCQQFINKFEPIDTHISTFTAPLIRQHIYVQITSKNRGVLSFEGNVPNVIVSAEIPYCFTLKSGQKVILEHDEANNFTTITYRLIG